MADIIFAKIESGETEKTTVIQKTHCGSSARRLIPRIASSYTWLDPGEVPDPAAGLNPKVVELYTKLVFT